MVKGVLLCGWLLPLVWEAEEKDEMVGWHPQLNAHESEQAPGDGEGHGSLVCCSPQGGKESDVPEQLNNNRRQGWKGRDSRACFRIGSPPVPRPQSPACAVQGRPQKLHTSLDTALKLYFLAS